MKRDKGIGSAVVSRTIRVMVVDDTDHVRRMLTSMLSLDGYEVVADVASGPAAIEAVQEADPDIVVIDYKMPSMDGLETARRIRSSHPQQSVILYTAFVDPHTRSLQIELLRIRHATGGDQQPVAEKIAAIGGDDHFFATLLNVIKTGIGHDLDMFVTKNIQECLADGRIEPRQQRAAREQRDTTAETCEGLGELHRHGRAANDEQSLGNERARERIGGCPPGCAFEPCDGWHRRACTGGVQCPIEWHRAFLCRRLPDQQRMRVSKTCIAVKQVDTGRAVDDVLVFTLPQSFDKALLLSEEAMT